MGDGHYLTPGPAGFEDGTVNYLSLPAVEIGLKLIESIGIDTIHTRVMCLTGWLIDQLRGAAPQQWPAAGAPVWAGQYRTGAAARCRSTSSIPTAA